jgi:hypothetical protein
MEPHRIDSRNLLSFVEMVSIREAIACSQIGESQWPLWALLTYNIRSVQQFWRPDAANFCHSGDFYHLQQLIFHKNVDCVLNQTKDGRFNIMDDFGSHWAILEFIGRLLKPLGDFVNYWASL